MRGTASFRGAVIFTNRDAALRMPWRQGRSRRADMKTIWNCTVNWNRNSDIEEEKYELYFGAVSSGGGFSMSCRTDEADRGKRGKVSAFLM